MDFLSFSQTLEIFHETKKKKVEREREREKEKKPKPT